MDNLKNNSYLFLNSIANGIYAGNKIFNLLTENSNTRSKNDKIVEIIKIIVTYLPNGNDYHISNLRKLADKSNIYTEVYKKLKQQIASRSKQQFLAASENSINTLPAVTTGNQIAETIAAIKPIIKPEYKSAADKLQKILEILTDTE